MKRNCLSESWSPRLMVLFRLPFRALRAGMRILRFRGIRYFGYLLTGYLLPRILFHFYVTWPFDILRRIVKVGLAVLFILILAIALVITGDLKFILMGLIGVVSLALLVRWTWVKLQLRYMLKQTEALEHNTQTYPSIQPATWDSFPINPEFRRAVEAESADSREIVLATIDQDGRVFSLFGEFPYFPSVSEQDFLPRKRYNLDIVLLDNLVLLRKDFKGNRLDCVRERYNLARLRGNANVPWVRLADSHKAVLYLDLILGRTVREILREHGALLRDSDTLDDPSLINLSPEARTRAIESRGTAIVPKCLSAEFLDSLREGLNAIHCCRLANMDIKFGNILVDDHDQPWWVDFHSARFYPKALELIFAIGRDRDHLTYNRIFDLNLITEARARAELDEFHGHVWYSPVDFGFGLSRGSFWSTDFGSGRWERFNRDILHNLVGSLQDKRILDLGSNNGVMPIMMLSEGAREVIGVEIGTENARLADLVKEIFEWRHIERYRFCIYNGNMFDILTNDWGKFDLVTAFCSLYFLSESDMKRVVQRASELAPVILLQTNLNTCDPEELSKSTPEFLADLLQENGFREIKVCAPRGFTRPMIVGKKSG